MKALYLLSFFLIAELAVAQQIHIQEDFNTSTIPNGWSVNPVSGTQNWQFGLDGSSGQNGNNNIDGTSMSYFDDDDLGSTSTNNTASLISPNFDNSSFNRTILKFDYNFRSASVGDSLYVEVFDGTQWNIVFSRTQDSCGNWLSCNFFPTESIDISSFASSNCQVRFTYHDGNDWGWYAAIDNVSIISNFDHDLQLLSIDGPISNCNLGSSESVSIQVYNAGLQADSNFSVAYSLNSGAPIAETITNSIKPGDTLLYTFTTSVNLSTLGPYSLEARHNLSTDQNSVNDSLIKQIVNDSAVQLPYYEDFELSSHAFQSSPPSSSWDRGIPSNMIINSASSGRRAFVSNLTGNYQNNEESYLISPCFDFSVNVNDPILSFDLIYESEAPFDFLGFEYSLNNGASWNPVPKGNYTENWYGPTLNGWAGNSGNQWLTVVSTLDGFALEPSVKFRFRLKTDNLNTREGFGVDNFKLEERISNDLVLVDYTINDTLLCGLSDTSRLGLIIENFGVDTIHSFNISVDVSGDSTIAETKQIQILPYSSERVDFNKIFDFSAYKLIELDFNIAKTGDVNSLNDSLLDVILDNRLLDASIVPYYEDFEEFTVPHMDNGWFSEWDPFTPSMHWRSGIGDIQSPYKGPDADNTTGSGTYLHSTARSGAPNRIARVVSPCIDLRNSSNPYLEFWYHLFDNHPNDQFDPYTEWLSIDVYDGKKWNIAKLVMLGNQQDSSASPFKDTVLHLSDYIGKIIRLGFRTRSLGGPVAIESSIDDISVNESSLLESIGNDIYCSMSSSGKGLINLNLKNSFPTSLGQDSIFLWYSVNGISSNTDTVRQTVDKLESLNFVFSDSLDFNSASLPLRIVVYSRVYFNNQWITDSLVYNDLQNPLLDNYLFENFEKVPLSNDPTVLGWTLDSSFRILNEDKNAFAYSPSEDASVNGDQYLFSTYESNSANTDARRVVKAILPCVNLKVADSIKFKFNYYAFGLNTTLYVGIWNNGQLTTILDSIQAVSFNAQWQKKTLDISSYAGQNIQLAFQFIARTQFQTNTIALDNIQIVDHTNILDASLLANDIDIQNCNYQNGVLSLEIENNGGLDILPNTLTASYQVDQLAPVSQAVNNSILSGQTISFSFNTPIAASVQGRTYSIKTWLSHASDTLSMNDSIDGLSLTNHIINDSLLEDFESFIDGSCFNDFRNEFQNGWESDFGIWTVHDGLSCGDIANLNSGPGGTSTNSLSKFLYINPPSTNGFQAAINSPCIDISNNGVPYLSFDYHMYGSDINTLFVEVNANGTWQMIDSLIRQKQSSKIEDWKSDTISLSKFISNPLLKIRFRSLVTGPNSHIAIDNIEVADSSIFTNVIERFSEKQTPELHVYPNPTNSILNLEIDEKLINSRALVYSSNGQVVYQTLLRDPLNQIDISEQRRGLYFIVLPESGITSKVILN